MHGPLDDHITLGDERGILKGIACEIRINLTKARPSDGYVWERKDDVTEEDAEMSVPEIWAEHTFQAHSSIDNSENWESEDEEDDDQDMEAGKEVEGEKKWSTTMDELPGKGGNGDHQCEADNLKTWTAKGYACGLPVVSLDNLIAKKTFSQDEVKKLIGGRETGHISLDSLIAKKDFSQNEVRKLMDERGSVKAKNDDDPWLRFYAFTCKKCGQKFDQAEEEAYLKHSTSCTEKVAKCSQCGKTYSSIYKLNRHMVRTHRQCRWSCNKCSAQFTWKKDLIKHASTVHDDRPFKCEKCSKRFVSEENLRIHAVNHNRLKSFACTECAKAFVDKTKLQMHMLVHTQMEKPFKCEKCGAAFFRKASLGMHVKRVHEEPLVCKICGVSIRGAVASLRQHMLNVHGEKYKYECDVCDKDFETQYELQAHRKSHVNSYQCNICGKIFTWKASYKQHMERHSDVPQYECPKCGKGFYTDNSRHKHIKYTHGNDRIYHCDVCTMSFKTLDVLKHHKEIHENKRKYKCKICGKGFNNPSSLTNHKKVHSRENVE